MNYEKQGELCLYVSYAPGAGKTYYMVKSAENRALLGEKVFYAHIYNGHRDVVNSSDSYSLDKILQNMPDLVVLDELAMKGRNTDDITRGICDDIEQLLKNGIDVYSTVNLLHFSYVNEACKDKTGFHVKKPLSDEWLVQAKTIFFIDCPPEFLNQAYNDKILFTKIKKTKTTDLIFRLENLRLFRSESIQLLKKFSQVKRIHNNRQ